MRPPPRPSRPGPSPAFTGISDSEWLALLPFLLHRSPQGRPLKELRTRMEGIFHIAASHAPWRELPERFGKAETVARYFRRLTHAGLWQRLLEALAEAGPRHPLQGLRAVIARACRRALRIAGPPLMLLARRLEIRQALPGPPWLLPDPDLSETCNRALRHLARPGAPPGLLETALPSLRQLAKNAAGRRRIPRSVRLGWG
ncbi:transposase [Teichococcus aestuarii]|uniref:IS5/IS1182 family transposase n=1 Tax=Teichococcus aestuarii TaxID=568898 RepID=A0A2U1UYJ1_9PROT|nr:transposase [Pseudoroseomonas aestuarii]PWC26723.1 IS5/IS1182 family transposase [Pseudoroseomonas aestuarii]